MVVEGGTRTFFTDGGSDLVVVVVVVLPVLLLLLLRAILLTAAAVAAGFLGCGVGSRLKDDFSCDSQPGLVGAFFLLSIFGFSCKE